MDDVVKSSDLIKKHNHGPNYAWRKGLRKKIIIEHDNEEYYAGRGLVWGKYIH